MVDPRPGRGRDRGGGRRGRRPAPILRFHPAIYAQAAATAAAMFEDRTFYAGVGTGEEVSHDGDHYTVENARLYTLPEETPPICVSA